jgi:hypothetical protein
MHHRDLPQFRMPGVLQAFRSSGNRRSETDEPEIAPEVFDPAATAGWPPSGETIYTNDAFPLAFQSIGP